MESTAYPAYDPTPFNHRRTPCCCRRTVVCRYIIGATFLFLLAVIIYLFTWFPFRKHFPHISLASASVAGLNVTASSITGQWDVSFDVRNPNNRMTVSYEGVGTSVGYKWTKLSHTDLAPFRQGAKKETKVAATLAVVGAYVHPEAMKELNAERARGSVKFTVAFEALVTVKASWWKWKSKTMHVVCDQIPFAFPGNSNNGTYAGGSHECFSF